MNYVKVLNIPTIILWSQCRDISVSISIANFSVEEKYGKLCRYNQIFPPIQSLLFDLRSRCTQI